ncbi:MAG: BACON domain-containing protein [Bacteroidales bacterium]|jgi:hypothetical protein|nr:BACON domain-containing protein [Bacteroidales bacterium]
MRTSTKTGIEQVVQRMLCYSGCWLLLLAGCRQSDNDGQAPEESEHFPVTVRTVTYSLDDAAENRVETMDVLAFKVTGGNEYYAYKEKGLNIQTSTTNVAEKIFHVFLRKEPDEYRYVFIANARREIDNMTFSGSKQQILSRIQSLNTGMWDVSAAGKPLPMWGESPRIKLDNSTEINNMFLLRALLRVDMLVTGKAASVFKLKTVYVYNRKTRGRIVPEEKNWDFSGKKVTAPSMPDDNDPSSPLNVRTPIRYSGMTSEFSLFKTIYLHEAPANNKDDLEATCLVVGGQFGGSKDTTYYRIDFEQSGVRTHLLRNHLYEVRIINVSAAGASTPEEAFSARETDMEVNIVQWNMQRLDCNVNLSSTLTVSQSVFAFPLSGGQAVLSVTSDHSKEWSVKADDAWITIKRNSPDVLFSVPASASARTGWLTVTSGNLVKKIKIQQN